MRIIIATIFAVFLTACTATTSTVVPQRSSTSPSVGILTLDGPLGEQAADLISVELASRGLGVAERGVSRDFLAVDTDFSSSAPAQVAALGQLGRELGVTYVLAGTVSTEGGPLYSFDHVNMTLRLVDVANGQTRWVGRYGNALWTSAISTQGDLQRGARQLADEFINSGAADLLGGTR